MKKLRSLLLIPLLLAGLCVNAYAAKVQATTQKLTVDGRAVACECYNIDGYNYFKLRDLAYLLRGTGSQFSVDWDGARKTVSVVTGAAYTPDGSELKQRDDMSSTAVASAQRIVVNGVTNYDLAPYNIGGYNFFGLQALGKALGFDVSYDTATRTMIVKSRAAATSAGQAASSARLGLTADAGREYLDKIVFLGDSTTYGIGAYYKLGYTALCPPSQVWTPKSGTLTLSYYNIATIVYPPTGEEISIVDAVTRAKPEIMVITLGVNGISFMDKDWFISDYTSLVQNIQAASPDTKIILNSIYPVADSYKYQKDINNKKINAANEWIESIAVSTGVRFLYSWECLAVNGKLPESAQNGDGLHLTGESFTKVMDYIRTHALS